MKKSYLDEFEGIILLTVSLILLYEQAFRITIHHRSFGTSCWSFPSIVRSHLAGVTAGRGGKQKKFFTVTPSGSRALHEIREVRQQLWPQLPVKALQWKMQ